MSIARILDKNNCVIGPVRGVNGNTLATGYVGEYIVGTPLAGAQASGATLNWATATLGEGIWLMSAAVQINTTGAVTVIGFAAGFNTTSATFPVGGANSVGFVGAAGAAEPTATTYNVGPFYLPITTPSTVYLIGNVQTTGAATYTPLIYPQFIRIA